MILIRTAMLLDFNDKDTFKDVIPAWIQAIGSIFAILISGLISAKQIKHEKDLERHRLAITDLSKLQIVRCLIIRSYGLLKDVRNALERGQEEDFMTVSPWTMRNTKKAIDNLNLFDIPEGLLALDMLTIGPSLEEIASIWDRCMEESRISENNQPSAESLRELEEASKEVFSICDSAFKLVTEKVNDLNKVINN